MFKMILCDVCCTVCKNNLKKSGEDLTVYKVVIMKDEMK